MVMRLLFIRVCGRVGVAAGHRHGVEPARVPGMTTGEAPERERAATEHAKAQQRFQRVLRAARMETARGTEQRANGPLIQTDQERGDVAQCSLTFFHSAARLSRPAVAEAARAAGGTTRR